MNKHLFTIALTGLALATAVPSVSAHDEEEQTSRPVYRQHDEQQNDGRYDNGDRFHRGGRLSSEVDHLNRMTEHVQRELRQYHGSRHIWSEYQHIRYETSRLNSQFRRGEQFYNRGRLHAEIEHIHGELHHLEQELHVRSGEWYQWR